MESYSQSPSGTGVPLMIDASILGWAEEVCKALEGSGPIPLANLARRIPDATTNEVAIAIGWLAREGRIRFGCREGIWEMSLRERSPVECNAHTGEASRPKGAQGGTT
jgi:hypothetical protein